MQEKICPETGSPTDQIVQIGVKADIASASRLKITGNGEVFSDPLGVSSFAVEVRRLQAVHKR
jgi:hypothetical protein